MYSSLAELVTQRRTALGYTMRSLAARVGVSSAYIAHIEHGRIATPSPQVLAALARELHVSEETLLRSAICGPRWTTTICWFRPKPWRNW
jgi:transcriptional regulator with XRE-family HTH domain